jgi:YidC/Oxa1 family membrane protein insertase
MLPPIPFANPLQPLIDVCEQVLLFFHDTVGTGWGLSIILLTVTVRLILLPLTIKQVTSMQRLQVLAPEMKAIQAKYRDDKQRQQQEMMKFYKENRVNPLASCLPLLLQLPFFIALFYMLQDDLRRDICGQTAKACADATAAQFARAGATPGVESFLFIPDLTNNATGAVLVVLIALYVASQLGSGLLSSASMDRNQRMLMLGLPILFVAFIINFPAGLLVYWITTNIWTIVQQLIVRKTVGVVRRPELAGAGAPVGAAALAGGKGNPGSGGKAAKAAAKESGNGSRAATGGSPPQRRKKKRTGRRR